MRGEPAEALFLFFGPNGKTTPVAEDQKLDEGPYSKTSKNGRCLWEGFGQGVRSYFAALLSFYRFCNESCCVLEWLVEGVGSDGGRSYGKILPVFSLF